MTKRHFEYAARVVRQFTESGQPIQARVLAMVFARMFEEFGPRFDRVRFLRACMLAEDTTNV